MSSFCNVFAIFHDKNFNVLLANNFVKFWKTGPRKLFILLHLIKRYIYLFSHIVLIRVRHSVENLDNLKEMATSYFVANRKAMTRNPYNYLTSSAQTPKGKKDILKATTPQSKHYKQKAKRTVSFPRNCMENIMSYAYISFLQNLEI